MVFGNLALFCAFVAVVPAPGLATAASTEIFPALRKRLQAKKFAAAQVRAEPSQVVVPEPAQPAGAADNDVQQAPEEVPKPLDIGADGFPVLPAVASMLSQASGTLKSVNSQASVLEARMVQAQMQSESKMAKQKAAFEQKLREQEKGNRAVINANTNITAQIKTLKRGNAAFKKHARELEENNRLMRSELRTLLSRLGGAKDFTQQTLTSTDDSKSALLQVLKGGSHHHHHALVETSSRTAREGDDGDEEDSSDNAEESEDSDRDDSEEDDESTSLLALSMKVHRTSMDGTSSFEAAMNDLEAAVPSNPMAGLDSAAGAAASSPGDLLEVLSKDVAHLAAQEKESEKTLKNLFVRDYRAGAKRKAALLAQQKGLIASRGSLLALQTKLKEAEAHLEATRKQLEGRLHGLGQYLQKLAHFAMAPQREVPHLLEVLPKSVTVKADKVI